MLSAARSSFYACGVLKQTFDSFAFVFGCGSDMVLKRKREYRRLPTLKEDIPGGLAHAHTDSQYCSYTAPTPLLCRASVRLSNYAFYTRAKIPSSFPRSLSIRSQKETHVLGGLSVLFVSDLYRVGVDDGMFVFNVVGNPTVDADYEVDRFRLTLFGNLCPQIGYR